MVKSITNVVILPLTVLLFGVFAGCSDSNPISAFEPEVVNNADAFQFQITDATDVTTTLNYSWTNSGTRATIDHSTAMVSGSAFVTIKDAAGVQVYSSELKASGVETSAIGTAGTWNITVGFSNFDGTSNFRAEKL
jgi:hypothetical protein